jgi:hypothetical protein
MPNPTNLKRFNLIIHEVEGAEEERPVNYISLDEVQDLISNMGEDDEIVVQRTQDADPNAIYP